MPSRRAALLASVAIASQVSRLSSELREQRAAILPSSPAPSRPIRPRAARSRLTWDTPQLTPAVEGFS